jgi:DNA polymerase-3 subunit delta'
MPEHGVLPEWSADAAPLPWQLAAWSRLQSLRAASALPHALLLSGPEGVGKTLFAAAFAKQLLCASPTDRGACGCCHACALVVAGTHPDFHQLLPDGRAERIRIDAVRALCQLLAGKAQMLGHKVALIQPAERLNTNAANALLKTLEEPAAGTFIILVSDKPRLLPATVRSRCQTVGFGLPSAELLRHWAQSQALGPEFDAALRLSGGRPMQARRWISDGTAEKLLLWYQAVDQWRSGQLTLQAFEQACDGLGWDLLLRECTVLLLDVLKQSGFQMAADQRQGVFRLLDALHRYRAESQRGVALNQRMLLAGVLPRLQRALAMSGFSAGVGSANLVTLRTGDQP